MSAINSADAVRRLQDAAITFAAVVLAFAAVDDITTDNAEQFTVEYAALLGCAAGLLFVSVRLMRSAHRVLGGISLLALAAAIWSQRAIGPGIVPGFWTEYVVWTIAVLWFAVLSVVLLAIGCRELSTDRQGTGAAAANGRERI